MYQNMGVKVCKQVKLYGRRCIETCLGTGVIIMQTFLDILLQKYVSWYRCSSVHIYNGLWSQKNVNMYRAYMGVDV
jgi:hypothetical protein